jgi:hypothetical protein
LDKLLEAIDRKYGFGKAQELKEKIKPTIVEWMNREFIFQIISLQAWYRRIFFLVWYPSLFIPYMCRVKPEKKL